MSECEVRAILKYFALPIIIGAAVIGLASWDIHALWIGPLIGLGVGAYILLLLILGIGVKMIGMVVAARLTRAVVRHISLLGVEVSHDGWRLSPGGFRLFENSIATQTLVPTRLVSTVRSQWVGSMFGSLFLALLFGAIALLMSPPYELIGELSFGIFALFVAISFVPYSSRGRPTEALHLWRSYRHVDFEAFCALVSVQAQWIGGARPRAWAEDMLALAAECGTGLYRWHANLMRSQRAADSGDCMAAVDFLERALVDAPKENVPQTRVHLAIARLDAGIGDGVDEVRGPDAPSYSGDSYPRTLLEVLHGNADLESLPALLKDYEKTVGGRQLWYERERVARLMASPRELEA